MTKKMKKPSKQLQEFLKANPIIAQIVGIYEKYFMTPRNVIVNDEVNGMEFKFLFDPSRTRIEMFDPTSFEEEDARDIGDIIDDIAIFSKHSGKKITICDYIEFHRLTKKYQKLVYNEAFRPDQQKLMTKLNKDLERDHKLSMEMDGNGSFNILNMGGITLYEIHTYDGMMDDFSNKLNEQKRKIEQRRTEAVEALEKQAKELGFSLKDECSKF